MSVVQCVYYCYSLKGQSEETLPGMWLTWLPGLYGKWCPVGLYCVIVYHALCLIIWTKSLLVLICDPTGLFQTPKKPINQCRPNEVPSSHWKEERKGSHVSGDAAPQVTVPGVSQ